MTSTSPLPEAFTNSAMNIVYDEDGRGHIIHSICKSDTLAGLAIKYGVEVMDIKRANRLIDDRQMFAQKSLRIPLPGSYPPSPALTNTPPATSRQSHHSYGKAPVPSSRKIVDKDPADRRTLSPAMGLLRGYYGLRSPPRREEDEGMEMLVYKSDAEMHSEKESSSASSLPSRRWALVSPDGQDPLQNAVEEGESRKEERGIDSLRTHWNDSSGVEENRGWDFRAGGRSQEGGEGDGGEGEGAPLMSGVNPGRQDSFGRRKMSGNGRRGRRSSQAEEVAAVVEELARAHRDNFVPAGMAGEGGRGGSGEDLQGEKLTRRRTRGDSDGPSASNSPAQLGGREGTRKSISEKASLPSRSGRGDVPGRGPRPKSEVATENLGLFSMGSTGLISSNGLHSMDSRSDITHRIDDAVSTEVQERGLDRGVESSGSLIKKSSSSPALEGVPSSSNFVSSFSTPLGYVATSHKSVDKLGRGGSKGVSLRRNGSKAAID